MNNRPLQLKTIFNYLFYIVYKRRNVGAVDNVCQIARFIFRNKPCYENDLDKRDYLL